MINNSAQVKKLLEYDLWASRLLMEQLMNLKGESLAGVIRLLSHVTNAQDIWLSRISDHVMTGGVWDSFDVKALYMRIEYLNTLWKTETERLDADPEEVISYQTHEGEEFKTLLSDIFSHVINHGTHHRGQVSRIIRESGYAPPQTDYIYYCRLG